MKELYQLIRARIEGSCPSIKHVRLFNNQFSCMENQEQIPFPFPCVFIEFANDIAWIQQGNGVQFAQDLQITLHIGHEFYNGADQEENLIIFDIRNEVFTAMQGFTGAGITNMVRVSERVSTDYTNIYIFQQNYNTNLRETLGDRPVNGIPTGTPVTLSLISSIETII